MPTPAYLSITGRTQGNISEGASTDKSIGNTWQEGHEDEILVQSFDHNVLIPTNPQNGQPSGPRRHEKMVIRKNFDKSTPLLYNALTSGELMDVELKWFRTAADGTSEHYFTTSLTDAVITDISACMAHCQDPNTERFGHEEQVSFNYRKIEWRHETAGTAGEDDWRKPDA
ncbi:MAG: Hcp family type VI secretion system effector [Gammaproteobacteria bacterium]